MPLPVLQSSPASTPVDWVRLFHQSQVEYCRAVGEEIELDFGRWICNPSLPETDEANCLVDAFLLPGLNAADLIADVRQRCAARGTPWRVCSLNPSVALDRVEPLAAELLRLGWKDASLDILRLTKIAPATQAAGPRSDSSDEGDPNSQPSSHGPEARVTMKSSELTIIPARAGFRHYRQLMLHRDAMTADAALLHLDDPHLDTLMVLRGNEPAGCISLLTTGQTGTIHDWYGDNPAHLLQRAIEIAQRGLLRHVMIGLPADAAVHRHIVVDAGFETIGKWQCLRRGN